MKGSIACSDNTVCCASFLTKSTYLLALAYQDTDLCYHSLMVDGINTIIQPGEERGVELNSN